MLGIIMLALSAAFTVIAIAQRAEPQLFAAVIAFAGTGIYLVAVEPWLFPAGLAIALGLSLSVMIRLLTSSGRPDGVGEAAFFIGGQ